MIIKSVLESLNHEQRRRLTHAFENGFSQFIEYESGKFVGVNVRNVPNLETSAEVGAWSVGKIK